MQNIIRPTRCKKCHDVLAGLRKQGLQCRDCKYNACKKCVERQDIAEDCPGDILDDDRKYTYIVGNDLWSVNRNIASKTRHLAEEKSPPPGGTFLKRCSNSHSKK